LYLLLHYANALNHHNVLQDFQLLQNYFQKQYTHYLMQCFYVLLMFDNQNFLVSNYYQNLRQQRPGNMWYVILWAESMYL